MTSNAMKEPSWVQKMKQVYMAGEAFTFVLYGNVLDHVWTGDDLLPMKTFLTQWMKKVNKSHWEYTFHRGLGEWLIQGNEELEECMWEGQKEKDGPQAVQILENHLNEGKVLVSFPFAGALLGADGGFGSDEEKRWTLSLQEWALDENIAKKDTLIVLQVESLSQLPSSLLSNPKVVCIEIGLPSMEDRLGWLMQKTKKPKAEMEMLAQKMAGLKLIQMEGILGYEKGRGMNLKERQDWIFEAFRQRHLTETGNASSMDEAWKQSMMEKANQLAHVTGNMSEEEMLMMLGHVPEERDGLEGMLQVLSDRKKTLIEKECSGLIEFMSTSYDLSHVGGNHEIKKELQQIAQLIKSGDRKLSPMGLLAVGPMGAGKTFIIKAFLKEAGLTGLTLKNFRSKWVGSTESNLEKVLSTIKAMGPVALIMDESDRSFGQQGDSDGGTSSRVIARLKEFMSDPDNRGQVLFIMMTNRPDKLDTDIKRPGRLDRKIPFFYAQTSEEVVDIVKVLCKRYEVPMACTLEQAMELNAVEGKGYSNADLEALVGLYASLHAQKSEEELKVLNEDQKQAWAQECWVSATFDFIPPQEKEMIRWMELQAVKEASRKTLVPLQFQPLYEGNRLDQELKSLKRELNL